MDEIENQKIKIAIAALEKDFGKNAVIKLGNVDIPQIDVVPTGAPSLDHKLGCGGIPRGRIVEIYGGESAGKSSLAMSIVANAQAEGLSCLYVDAEHAVDLTYAASIGVDTDALFFSQPSTGEEALSIVDAMTSTGAFGVIVVDSVAALTPKAEMEGDIGQAHVGLLPRLMAQSLRKITANAHKTNTTIIFINQIREKIGIMFGNPETQPGGRALKFYSSVRLELRKKEALVDNDGEVVGVRTLVKIIKNKVGPPLRTAEFIIRYGEGIDKMTCIAEMAIEAGIFKKKGGGWIEYKDTNICQGLGQLVDKLNTEEDFYQEIYNILFKVDSDEQ